VFVNTSALSTLDCGQFSSAASWNAASVAPGIFARHPIADEMFVHDNEVCEFLRTGGA
jgi:hypothetical protein